MFQSRLKAPSARKEDAAFHMPLIVGGEGVVKRLVALKQSFPGGLSHVAIRGVEEGSIAAVRELNLISRLVNHGAEGQIRAIDGCEYTVKFVEGV